MGMDVMVVAEGAGRVNKSLLLITRCIRLWMIWPRVTRVHIVSNFSMTNPVTPVHSVRVLLLLLQYGDSAFKKMLSSVVDTECWEGACEAAAAQGKDLTSQLASANAVLGTLRGLQEQGVVELQDTQQQEEGWRREHEQKMVGG